MKVIAAVDIMGGSVVRLVKGNPANKAEDMLSIATRLVIGTMAYKEPDVIRKLVKKNPGKIVISVDQMDGTVMVKGWKESTGMRVSDAISQFIAIGVDEFLLTSIDRDGTLQGPDIKTLADASVSARIIASGGISSIEDVIRIRSAGCSSVIIRKAMYDGKVSIEKVKAVS